MPKVYWTSYWCSLASGPWVVMMNRPFRRENVVVVPAWVNCPFAKSPATVESDATRIANAWCDGRQRAAMSEWQETQLAAPTYCGGACPALRKCRFPALQSVAAETMAAPRTVSATYVAVRPGAGVRRDRITDARPPMRGLHFTVLVVQAARVDLFSGLDQGITRVDRNPYRRSIG